MGHVHSLIANDTSKTIYVCYQGNCEFKPREILLKPQEGARIVVKPGPCIFDIHEYDSKTHDGKGQKIERLEKRARGHILITSDYEIKSGPGFIGLPGKWRKYFKKQ